MMIIHTADLHLGQVIYQNYDRVDEHEHYFKQLEQLCRVGIISHREELDERIPVQIQVKKKGEGRSHVEIKNAL